MESVSLARFPRDIPLCLCNMVVVLWGLFGIFVALCEFHKGLCSMLCDQWICTASVVCSGFLGAEGGRRWGDSFCSDATYLHLRPLHLICNVVTDVDRFSSEFDSGRDVCDSVHNWVL